MDFYSFWCNEDLVTFLKIPTKEDFLQYFTVFIGFGGICIIVYPDFKDCSAVCEARFIKECNQQIHQIFSPICFTFFPQFFVNLNS